MANPKLIPALAYIRLSKEERTKPESLETTFKRQEELIKEYAKKHGYSVLQVLKDKYVSGGKLETPAFKELVRLADGVNVKAVIVKDLSRFARNLKRQEDAYNLLKRRGVDLKCVLDIDPAEKFQRRLMGIVNEQYLDKMRKDSRDLHVKRLEQGMPVSRPPFGYKIGKRKEWLVDEAQAQIVRDVYDKYMKGKSYSQLQAEYGFSKNMFNKILHDQTYLGYLVYTHRERDDDQQVYKQEVKLYKAKHKPIITQEAFDRVQKKLKSIRSTKEERLEKFEQETKAADRTQDRSEVTSP
jgi:site-specific DNA recombinase